MIFIYGPPGSGKTTLGKFLADELSLPFHDLDQEIETSSGMSIPEIFASEGEAGFRRRESELMHSLPLKSDWVMALGGGTLLDNENRCLVESLGDILCLAATPEVLFERLSNSNIPRPLLQGNPKAHLEALMTQRVGHYASFPFQLDVSNLSTDKLAWKAEQLLGIFHVSGMGSGYDVRLRAGSLDHIGKALASRCIGSQVAVIADETVAEIYGDRINQSLSTSGFQSTMLTFQPGEANKTIHTVINLWDHFVSIGLERGSTVLALGGGVTGDLAGFAASAFKRGVSWAYIPTSLLAMVDASLGGKTGVDLPQGKNLVGSFHPPSLVWVDPDTLSTLPQRELSSGMAEVVKAGIIGDPNLYQVCSQGWLTVHAHWSQILAQAMQVKIRVIEEDPYEKGMREALNLGHTIGHAVEHASGFRLRHGEAVAIGLVAECELAERLGLAEPGMAAAVADCLHRLDLPTRIPDTMSANDLLSIMDHDKKRRGGKLRFVLPRSIGYVQAGIEVEPWQIFSS